MDTDRIARNLAAVENHFHSEALNEVEAALETFTDDIVWEAPAPNGLNRSFSGKEATAKNYRELFASMRNVKFQFLQRFATEDRVVDDSIVTFEVAKDGYWHFQPAAKLKCGWFTSLRCATAKFHGSSSSTWDARCKPCSQPLSATHPISCFSTFHDRRAIRSAARRAPQVSAIAGCIGWFTGILDLNNVAPCIGL